MLVRSRFIAITSRIPHFGYATETRQAGQNKRLEDIRKKISNSTFLKYELTQNPEFDKAFPHLVAYKPATKITKETAEYDYVESLRYHKRVPEEKNLEETLKENRERFVEGYETKKGPIQWLSQEEKDKVHTAVELKMQELEETGLSRDELLYDGKVGGVPLALDPFFQFLKQNRLAREMLFKPGESFTTEKVIEYALRQDIGADPAFSRRPKNYLYEHQIDPETRYGMARNRIQDRQAFDPNAYFAENLNKLNMDKELLSDPHKKYFKMPVTREEVLKENLRSIEELDVHWRNTEFLTKFVGDSGAIRSRFQNRLHKSQQKLVSKTVKHARQLLMLPFKGYIKPTDKKSLRTLQEDIEDYLKKKINIETGQIYVDFPDEDLKGENPYKVEDPLNYNTQGHEGVKDLDFEFVPPMPAQEDIDLLEAHKYATKLKRDELKKQGLSIEKLQEEMMPDLDKPNIYRPADMDKDEEVLEKDIPKYAESFNKFKEQVKDIPAENFIQAYLSEKALTNKYLKNAKNAKSSGSKRSKEEILREIEKIKSEVSL